MMYLEEVFDSDVSLSGERDGVRLGWVVEVINA